MRKAKDARIDLRAQSRTRHVSAGSAVRGSGKVDLAEIRMSGTSIPLAPRWNVLGLELLLRVAPFEWEQKFEPGNSREARCTPVASMARQAAARSVCGAGLPLVSSCLSGPADGATLVHREVNQKAGAPNQGTPRNATRNLDPAHRSPQYCGNISDWSGVLAFYVLSAPTTWVVTPAFWTALRPSSAFSERDG